ncbi:MAG: helix-turn-helix transcriptional regulator [Tepidisphaeraceae bacterium]|jgi:DNA-binding CsgD family transcriptional regulator
MFDMTTNETTFQMNDLSPRQQQTLEGLKEGLSEKQLAVRLGISRHTVHVYVKAVYLRFQVSSRSELLSHFIASAEHTIKLLRLRLDHAPENNPFFDSQLEFGTVLSSAEMANTNRTVVA